MLIGLSLSPSARSRASYPLITSLKEFRTADGFFFLTADGIYFGTAA